MLKLKDVVWGEVDLSDEFSELDDTKIELEPNLGIIVVAMCCGGRQVPIGTDNGGH